MHTEHGRRNHPPGGCTSSPRTEATLTTISYWRCNTQATAVWLLGSILLGPGSMARAEDAPPPDITLKIVERTSAQDQGAWVVDYRLKNIGLADISIAPEQVKAKVEGWVSNSRVASHALPRWSSLVITHGPDLSTVGEVISAADEANRCREKLIVTIRRDEPRPAAKTSGPAAVPKPAATGQKTDAKSNDWIEKQISPKVDPKVSTTTALIDSSSPTPKPSTSHSADTSGKAFTLAPGQMLRLRLRIEHIHMIYGDYDPLLSSRSVELTLGGATVRDVVPLNREQYVAQPRFQWPDPPIERRDKAHCISPPDSLHLEAHVPGHHYYRFPERPVRYSTKMRLRFWYLVAAGTEGECKAKIAQYKDTPSTWKRLSDGGFEQSLSTVGRWARVERVFMTEAEATTVALEFSIVGDSDIGELWIDNVSLEPVDGITPGGP